MKHHCLPRGLVVHGIVALLLACHSAITLAGEEVQTVVIVNPSVVNESLSAQEIQNMYLGKKTQWDDGTSISLVTLDNEAIHEFFLRHFIKKTPSQFRIFWKKMEFTGKGASPKQMSTEEEVIEFVKATKGAVGYISLDKAGASGCKILSQKKE